MLSGVEVNRSEALADCNFWLVGNLDDIFVDRVTVEVDVVDTTNDVPIDERLGIIIADNNAEVKLLPFLVAKDFPLVEEDPVTELAHRNDIPAIGRGPSERILVLVPAHNVKVEEVIIVIRWHGLAAERING